MKINKKIKRGLVVMIAITGSWGGLLSINSQAQADSNDTKVINNAPDQDSNYNKPFVATKRLAVYDKYFYSNPGSGKRLASTRNFYNTNLKITRIANQNGNVYFKTNHGWLGANAFIQTIKYTANVDYKMKVTNSDVPVYNQPANTTNAQKVGSTDELGLSGKWYQVNKRADTNLKQGYYRIVTNSGTTYWIAGKYLSFNLSELKGNNAKLEKAIAAGESLIGKAKYDNYGGGRTAATIAAHQFDCSAFVHYVYSQGGINLGPTRSATTFTMKNFGQAVNPANMKRGDMFFFNAKGEGKFCHVGIYLGNNLFLHDSPSSDNGGADVSSLKDPYWANKFNGWVRRVA